MASGVPAERARTGAIVAAYAAVFAMGLVDNARGPAYPRILQSLAITAAAGSFMFTAASLGSLLVSWTGRSWLGRFGAARAVRPFSALLAGACAGMAAVGFGGLGLAGLVAVSIAFGVAATGCSMCANALVAERTSPENRRRLLSGMHAMYGAASLLSPLAVAACARLGLDWRWAFVALASVPAAACGLGSLARPAPAPPPPAPAEAALPPRRIAASTACLVLALYVAAELSISTRLPLLAERAFGWSADAAALCLGAFFALLLGGRLAFAVFRFPGSSGRWLAASAAASLAAFLVGLFLHPAGLAACGLTMSVFFPSAVDWIRGEFGGGWERAFASAVASVAAALVLMHLAVGVLTDVVGIRGALLLGPACLGGALLLLARARARRAPA